MTVKKKVGKHHAENKCRLSLRESSVPKCCLSLRESSVPKCCLSLRERCVFVSFAERKTTLSQKIRA